MSIQVKDQPARPSAGKHDAFIAGQLAKAAGRVRLVDLATAGLLFLAGSLGYACAVVLLDAAVQLSALTRQALLLLYLAAAVGYGYFAVVRPLRWRVNPHFAARQLEQTLPTSRNHLVNWIDLQDEPVPGTIRTALGQKAARDLGKADLDRAISGIPALLAAAAAGFWFLVFAGLFLLFGPSRFPSLLARAFGLDRPIATRTQVSILRPQGGDATVTIGNPVTIVAHVAGRVPDALDQDAPCLLYRPDDNEPWRQRFLRPDETGREWDTTVSSLDVGNGFTYKVTAGDDSTPEYRVRVRAAPLVTEFLATYRHRPYVGRADRTSTDRRLDGLRGTAVTVLARTNRDVKDGKLELAVDGRGADVLPAERVAGDAQAMRFRLTLDRPGRYHLSFTSTENERYAEEKHRYEIHVTPDHPPQAALTAPAKDVTLPANGHLEITGEASDDIGLAAAELRLRLVHGKQPLRARPYLADKLGKPGLGTPRRIDYRELLVLRDIVDAKGAAIALEPGTVIEYWLHVRDGCDFPAAQEAESRRFKITIEGGATNNPQRDKERQAARDRKEKHDKQQEDRLKQENEQREEQRRREEAQERAEQQKRDEKRKNEQGGDPKNEDKEGGEGEKKGGEKGKGQGDKKDDKSGEGGEGSAEQQRRDEETKQKAEELQRAVEKKEKEKGGQPQEQDGNAGEGRGEGQQQAGKAKQGGDKGGKPDDKAGEGRDEGGGDGKDKAGEGKGGGGGKAGESGAGRQEGAGGDDKGDGKAGAPPRGDAQAGKGKAGDKQQGRPGEARQGPPGEGADAASDRGGDRPPEGAGGQGRDSKQARDPKSGGAGEKKDGANGGQAAGKPGSPPKGGEKGGAGKSGGGKTPDGPPGSDRKAPPDAKGAGSPGESKGGADKRPDPRKATAKDVEKHQQDLKGSDERARQDAARALETLQKLAQNETTRDAAQKALEQAKKDFEQGKMGAAPQRPPDAPPPGKPEEATPKDVKDLAKGLANKSEAARNWARQQMEKVKAQARNPQARQAAQKELERDWQQWAEGGDAGKPFKAERPDASRPSVMQLEDFRKKVDRDVLKDAKMSREQFERFLKDYAELARRTPKDDGAKEALPRPSTGGALPATVGRPGATPPDGKVDPLRNEGRPKPPPGYRDAYKDLLERLNERKP